MRFKVTSGTGVMVIREGLEWLDRNLIDHTTERDGLFEFSELIVDPQGRSGCGPHHSTIGGAYAQLGYYGFRRHGWAMIVPAALVETIERIDADE